MNSSLGTQLRHLVELLDGAVAAAYVDAGLAYRPRYTPVMRSLIEQESATLGMIAEAAGISQPAATQTIALMIRDGLVRAKAGATDGRQKVICLTPKGRQLVPALTMCWQATAAAAATLEAELPLPLSQILDSARASLAAKSFGERIREARAALESAPSSMANDPIKTER